LPWAPVRSNGGLAGARRNAERLLHDFRNSVFRDAVRSAVARLDPFGEQLGAFARITCSTASGDVLTSHDSRIIDDVFPRGAGLVGATSRTPLRHLDPAINAHPVPCPYFFFEPRRDA